MVHFSVTGLTTLIRAGILVVLLGSTCSKSAVLSFDEKYAHLDAKIAKLEDKCVHFETLIKMKDQQYENLAEEVSQLKRALHVERESSSNFVKSLNVDDVNNKASFKSAIPRTCHEAILADPTLKSGMHWIDPDGQGVGDDPIYVYCDMAKGLTFISHDSESPVDVGYCVGCGCYFKEIKYNATIRQMTTLTELSKDCFQSIRYDCVSAPLFYDSWWTDKNGKKKYFWSGMDTDDHTCQCGIEVNCIDTSKTCNCDSNTPAQLFDDGVIIDKSILPITQLNFGLTESSIGVHTLGRLVCEGQVAVNGIPTSCRDLWQIGHILSGLYSIMGSKMVESVYCDFTKIPSDPDFEKWIGYFDVKSSSTYFYVQKNQTFKTINTPIPFEIEKLNVGNAMDLPSGRFTAPKPGIYYFSFTGLVSFPLNTGKDEVYLGVELIKNDIRIGLGTVDEANTIDSQLTPFSLISTLDLNVGDNIFLRIRHMTPGAYLYDALDWQSTHFTGWILEEDIAKSL